jgi:hypothetical protein
LALKSVWLRLRYDNTLVFPASHEETAAHALSPGHRIHSPTGGNISQPKYRLLTFGPDEIFVIHAILLAIHLSPLHIPCMKADSSAVRLVTGVEI